MSYFYELKDDFLFSLVKPVYPGIVHHFW